MVFNLGDMDELAFDSMSDDLSVLSRSPTPPEDRMRPRTQGQLPTPPLSQHSPSGTPSPLTDASLTDEDGPPPSKRRRISPSMPRETQRLDLYDASSQPEELERLVKELKNKRKIVVIAGAGISVSAGIPDFRSSTGLFSSLKTKYDLKASGKQLFDASVYRDANSTASFHDMIRTLHQSTKSASPTAFHHLIARLAHEGRLLRLYTQNVDGIDTSLPPLATQVPLPAKGPWPKTVQLHGGLEKMSCTKCNEISDFEPEEFDGPIPPECKACQEKDHIRTEIEGRRSHGIGRLRPRMVLYHEHNPDDEAIGNVTRADMRTRPDAVLVVGTTLKVPGVRRIVREMCAIVRDRRDGFTAWINNDPEPSGKEFEDSWDMIIKGTSDEVARQARLPQWDEPEQPTIISAEDAERISSSQEVAVVLPMTPMRTPKVTAQSEVPVESIELDWTKKMKAIDVATEGGKTDTSKRKAAPKQKKAPAKKNAAKATSTNAKLNFKVTKEAKIAAPVKGKMGGIEKAVPLSPSSTKSNAQAPPRSIKLILK